MPGVSERAPRGDVLHQRRDHAGLAVEPFDADAVDVFPDDDGVHGARASVRRAKNRGFGAELKAEAHGADATHLSPGEPHHGAPSFRKEL